MEATLAQRRPSPDLPISPLFAFASCWLGQTGSVGGWLTIDMRTVGQRTPSGSADRLPPSLPRSVGRPNEQSAIFPHDEREIIPAPLRAKICSAVHALRNARAVNRGGGKETLPILFPLVAGLHTHQSAWPKVSGVNRLGQKESNQECGKEIKYILQ